VNGEDFKISCNILLVDCLLREVVRWYELCYKLEANRYGWTNAFSIS